MNQLISIIVPIYNVQDYLRTCLESILSQTYTNIEIILVNDGSEDASEEICCEYAKRDERVKLYSQENRGLSVARNTGVSFSKGELIVFVDSDDYIAPMMVEKLYDAMKKANADLAMCGFKRVDQNGRDSGLSFLPGDKTIGGKEAIKSLFDENSGYMVAWNKLYKKSFLKNNIFPPGKIHEDEFVMHRIFSECKRVAVVSESLYFYVQRDGSIMSRLSIKSLDIIEAFCDRAYLCNKLGMDEEKVKSIQQAEYRYQNAALAHCFDKNTKAEEKLALNTLRKAEQLLPFYKRRWVVLKRQIVRLLSKVNKS